MFKMVTPKDPLYPKRLDDLKDPPKIIYYKGRLDKKIVSQCVGVVGSRRISAYGKKHLVRVVSELAKNGLTVVSGFMYGADALAHKCCLENGGRTIAIMGCGIDLIHPTYQKLLYTSILSCDGLIISEWPEKVPPSKWTFPRRNRLIAALSNVVIIVEAEANSGSMITAKAALKLRRPVFSFPRDIGSQNSAGVFELFAEGVKPFTSAAEILSFFGIRRQPSTLFNRNISKLSLNELTVFNLISRNRMSRDFIQQHTGFEINEINRILTFLILLDLIFEERGEFYVR